MSTEEGQALASKWDCPFHETSAALRHFVDDTFHSVVRQIRLREQETYSAESSRKNKKKLHVKDVGKMLKKIFHWIRNYLKISSSCRFRWPRLRLFFDRCTLMNFHTVWFYCVVLWVFLLWCNRRSHEFIVLCLWEITWKSGVKILCCTCY